MPILRPIETVADLIQELQTTEGAYKVFAFDGAEAGPIEVSLMTHRSHADAPHVWIMKAHDKEAALAGLIRDEQRTAQEIADLQDEMDKSRRKLRQLVEYRDRIAWIKGKVESK